MIQGRGPRVPAAPTLVWGLFLGVAVWGYFVAFHQMSRALVGGFGSPVSAVVLSVVGTAMGALPLLALLPVALLPRWWFGRRLPERRTASGRCPDCGYPRTSFPCPECGGDGEVAAFDPFTRRRVGRLVLTTAGVFALGVGWAEFRVRHDETLFRREVEARVAAGVREPFSRPRDGWGSFATLRYDPAGGFDAPAPFDHPRIPGWRPAGRPASGAATAQESAGGRC